MASLQATTVNNFLRTLEQVRATGWYGAPTGSSYTGLGAELGVSSGQGYLLCYNRDTAAYGVLNIQGSSCNLQLSGSTINVSSGSLQQGGNQVLHAGNYSGYSSFSGQVSSSGNNGFANATWSANVRNPIWYFGNATTYGISYFQGNSGIGSSDTIGIHPNGTATAVGSAFSITPTASYVNNNIVLHAGNYSSYAAGLSTGNTFTGTNVQNSPNNTFVNTVTNANQSLTFYQGTAGADAYLTFHIGSDFAAYFGLGGAENDLVYGGWSVGDNRYRILHSGNQSFAWNLNQNLRTTDSPTFVDLFTSGLQIRTASPTITLRDTDHRTGFIHVNSNIFYVLTGGVDVGSGYWGIVANSRWPLEINLSNNNAIFGGIVDAISFTGAGTGLTGTAASLSIGGNAANVTGTVAVANGGTGVATSLANRFFATPNGSAGAPSFRAIVAADVPTLNQNTTGNAATATNLSTDRTNWSTNGTITAVVGQLAWKHYGNNHTIIDASNSTDPSGGSINSTNSAVAWSATYPTLMGWNGASTYGVRVDSCRLADSATSATSATTATTTTGNAGSVTYLPSRTDSTAYPVLWGAAYTNGTGTIAYSCAAVTIQSSTGTLAATTFSGALSGNASTATQAAHSTRLGSWDGTSYLAGTNSIASSGGRAVNLAPNTYQKQISFEFKNASFTTIAGNYAGLITIAPWEGTTASTGDPSYQLLFSPAGVNSTAAPVLQMRAGIDTTWGSWFTILHGSSTLTAGNLSGTIPSGVLGNSAHFIGTTSIALNRASASQTLTGVSIDGNAANVTGIVAVANGGTGVATSLANRFFATPNGSAGAPSFRAIVAADVPTLNQSTTGNAGSVTDGVYLSTTQTISGVKTFSSAPVATNIAKAWVHFNGTSAVGTNCTLNASHNVSSVAHNATGDYTVNFTTAMVDANYAVAGTVTIDYTSAQSLNQLVLAVPRQTNAQVAGSCRLATEYIHGAALYDAVAVRAVFFR